MYRLYQKYTLPVQAKVLPISEKNAEYASKVYEALRAAGVRVELDSRSEKVGYKIREAQMQKIPYMIVLGDKEAEAGPITVRTRTGGDMGAMEFDAFAAQIQNEIATLANGLE